MQKYYVSTLFLCFPPNKEPGYLCIIPYVHDGPPIGNHLLSSRTNVPTKHMYDTEGVDSVATITELRSETSDLIDQVRKKNNGILIQKNNEPHAVLISWDTYKAIKEKVNLDEL